MQCIKNRDFSKENLAIIRPLKRLNPCMKLKRKKYLRNSTVLKLNSFKISVKSLGTRPTEVNVQGSQAPISGTNRPGTWISRHNGLMEKSRIRVSSGLRVGLGPTTSMRRWQ